jgi:hypothetical protein
MPAEAAEEPSRTSYVPAVLAMACAWMIALIRVILGIFSHEGSSADVVLSAVVAALLPLAALYAWRVERPRATAAEQDLSPARPRLVLVSGQKRTRSNGPRVVAPMGKGQSIDACLTHGSLIKTLSLHAQNPQAGHIRRSEGRS